jgi:hypothetical protein
MLLRLGIEEDEYDDLVLDEEEGAPNQGIKWMALVKVHTSNYFSSQTFEQHMKVAWSPAQQIDFQHLEGNLFTIQCRRLGDWLKVSEGGSCLFRQFAVSIEPYDDFANPEIIDLNFFTTWIQIHKIPVGYRKKAIITNQTEKKVGKVIDVQLAVQGAGNFVRVKVRLDVRKPLARFVSISREGARVVYPIKFEKMPRFCGACGFVGHTHQECASGEYEDDKLKWGDFLKAEWDTWFQRGFGGGRGGGRSGRGTDPRGRGSGSGPGRDRFEGMGGHGTNPAWRHNAIAYFDGIAQVVPNEINPNGRVIVQDMQTSEEELKDTSTSPVKNNMMDLDKPSNSTESGTKRSLDMTLDGLTNPQDTTGEGIITNHGVVAGLAAHEGIGENENAELDHTKKPKKDIAVSPSLGSAGSVEEPVRSQ